MKTRDIGILGERLAAKYLEEHGYRVMDTNYHSRDGEIDVVVTRDGITVFVEVRTKTSLDFGTPEESVTSRKKQKILLTAQDYAQKHNLAESSWRIDFIAVELDKEWHVRRIGHIESAVGEESLE